MLSTDQVALFLFLAALGSRKYDVPFSLEGVPIVGEYVSRDQEMETLEQSLLLETESIRRKIFVLYGLGGIGKTQLSLAFARKHQYKFSAIFCLDGQTRSSLKQNIADIAKRLPQGQISEEARSYCQQSHERLENAIQEVIGWLSRKGNSNWLLIYDNVDRDDSTVMKDLEAYDVDEFLPQADHGSIIITTRQLRLRDMGKRLKLTEMTAYEGLKLLETRMDQSVTGTRKFSSQE